MFRVVFFVEDNKLSKVLHSVQGLVLNMEPPQPVVNAMVVGTDKKIKQESAATSIKGKLIEYLGSIKGSRISITDMRKKWAEFGGLPTSLNGSLMTVLVEEKHLKRISRGQYMAI